MFSFFCEPGLLARSRYQRAPGLLARATNEHQAYLLARATKKRPPTFRILGGPRAPRSTSLLIFRGRNFKREQIKQKKAVQRRLGQQGQEGLTVEFGFVFI